MNKKPPIDLTDLRAAMVRHIESLPEAQQLYLCLLHEHGMSEEEVMHVMSNTTFPGEPLWH